MDEQVIRQDNVAPNDGTQMQNVEFPRKNLGMDAAERLKILQSMNTSELIDFVNQAGTEINDFHKSLASFTEDIGEIEHAVKYKGHKALRVTADIVLLIGFLTIMVLIAKYYHPKAGKDQEMWNFWLVLYCLIAFIKETIMIAGMKRADKRKKYAAQHAGEQISRITTNLQNSMQSYRCLTLLPKEYRVPVVIKEMQSILMKGRADNWKELADKTDEQISHWKADPYSINAAEYSEYTSSLMQMMQFAGGNSPIINDFFNAWW
ncbi:MAG: hypothetical protein SPL63_12245 [Roseburia faecis]|nr:hypothetical protein [Roseburia faecis]